MLYESVVALYSLVESVMTLWVCYRLSFLVLSKTWAKVRDWSTSCVILNSLYHYLRQAPTIMMSFSFIAENYSKRLEYQFIILTLMLTLSMILWQKQDHLKFPKYHLMCLICQKKHYDLKIWSNAILKFALVSFKGSVALSWS